MEKKERVTLGYFRNVLIPVIFYSGVSGIIVGIVVCLYNFAANFLTKQSQYLYQLVRDNPYYVPVLFAVLVILALIAHFLLKYNAQCRGSGVPRTEGVLRGLLTFKWLRILSVTVASSLLSFFGGLSLGSEGPSIQIGATSAQGAAEILRCRTAWSGYVMSGGSGAGLAVAFNAPLTGIIFVIEEVHKRVTPMIVLTASSAVLFGTLTSNALSLLWGGQNYLFDMGLFSQLPLKNIWMLLILGLAVGFSSLGFNLLIIKSQKLMSKFKKIPQWLKLISAFVICGAIGLALTDTIGGGHSLIMKIGSMDFAIQMLLLLFVAKLFLILVSFNSGATGGLFIPMLSIGALLGGIFGRLFMLMGMNEIYYKTIVVISMSAFFGSCVRTPLTALVLIVEVTGQLSGFLMTGITIFTAYFIAELFRVPPLYDALLENITEQEELNKKLEYIKFNVTIKKGAFADNKCIRDLLWPPRATVKTIHRGEELIVPYSDTKLHEGDVLVIKAETYNPDITQDYCNKLVNE